MIALDLFAGTGWGVACQRLGIEEFGVEIMPEARATRAANGMTTAYHDVWEGLETPPDIIDAYENCVGPIGKGGMYDLLIASPPCQTFSMAGSGAGRAALDEVLGLIRDRAYLDVEKLRAFGESHDPRTALVLTPLVHVARDAPLFVVFEQVPPVLPVWEACADEMRRWGYSVWTGIVNAEQYGVPQTRRRAVLIARADGGEAKMPTPTHSRYYNRDPQRLDEGVLPWVSMAEALGWGMTARPFVTAGNVVGRAEGIGGSGGKAAVQREKGGERWLERGQAEQVRTGMGKGMIERHGPRPGRDVMDPAFTILGGDGGNSQPGFGVKFEGLRGPWGMTERPYPTVSGGANSSEGAGGPDPLAIGGAHARKIIAGEKGREYPGRPEGAERVTVAEAAALQSYPSDFEWNVTIPETGKPVTRTKQFLQIGNAVPPLLAEAILREVLS